MRWLSGLLVVLAVGAAVGVPIDDGSVTFPVARCPLDSQFQTSFVSFTKLTVQGFRPVYRRTIERNATTPRLRIVAASEPAVLSEENGRLLIANLPMFA